MGRRMEVRSTYLHATVTIDAAGLLTVSRLLSFDFDVVALLNARYLLKIERKM